MTQHFTTLRVLHDPKPAEDGQSKYRRQMKAENKPMYQCAKRDCKIKCGHYYAHEKEIPGCVKDHREDCPSCRKV
jgi:hypothetical protein